LEKEKEDADARVASGQKRDLEGGEGEDRAGKKAKTLGGDEDEEEMEMDEDDDGE
jgi:hypothetical protein